jgi:hypothetical protein
MHLAHILAITACASLTLHHLLEEVERGALPVFLFFSTTMEEGWQHPIFPQPSASPIPSNEYLRHIPSNPHTNPMMNEDEFCATYTPLIRSLSDTILALRNRLDSINGDRKARSIPVKKPRRTTLRRDWRTLGGLKHTPNDPYGPWLVRIRCA